MGSPQWRHRPRSHSQLSTGTLSYQAISALQAGQRDRGRTTLSPAGRRAMHTFRKDPTAAPRTAAYATKSALTSGAPRRCGP